MWVDVLIIKKFLPTMEYRKSLLLLFRTSSYFRVIRVNESNWKLIGKQIWIDFFEN